MTKVKAHRVTHTERQQCQASIPFDDLDESTIQLWIAQAQQAIGRLGWTYNEFDYPELVYCTAVFLYNTERLRKSDRTYPFYTVHCQEDESRFETASLSVALGHFKRLQQDGKRVGVFHWLSSLEQKRLYASEGYVYSRDFGPQ